jgi:hypothetical protein
MHNVSGWGLDHPNKDIKLFEKALEEYRKLKNNNYVYDENDVAVDFTETEKVIINKLYKKAREEIGESTESGHYLVILERVIMFLAVEPNDRKFIHPAHAIAADCLRPGCSELDLYGFNDWGTGLGHLVRNQGRSTTITPAEKTAIWNAARKVENNLETLTFQFRTWSSLINRVILEVAKDSESRKYVPYKRMISRDIFKKAFINAYEHHTGKSFEVVHKDVKKTHTIGTKDKGRAQKDKSCSKRGGKRAAHEKLGDRRHKPTASLPSAAQGTDSTLVADDDYSPWNSWDGLHEPETTHSAMASVDASTKDTVDDMDCVEYPWFDGFDDPSSNISCRSGSLCAIGDGLVDSHEDGLRISSCRVLRLNGTMSIPLDTSLRVLCDLLAEFKNLTCWKNQWTPVFSETVPLAVEKTPTIAGVGGNVKDTALRGEGYLSLPCSREGVSLFLVIGVVYTKMSRGIPKRFAICIVPGSSKVVQLHVPVNKGYLRKALNKEVSGGHPESTLDDLSARAFTLIKRPICGIVNSEESVTFRIMTGNEVEMIRLWEEQTGKSPSEIQRVRSLDLSTKASSKPKICPTEWSRQADASLKEVLPYYETAHIRIVDDKRFKSSSGLPGGPRQQVLRYSLPDHLTKMNYENSGKAREKFIATAVRGIASVEVSAEELIELFDDKEIAQDPKKVSSLSAMLFSDPCWKLKFFKPQSIRVTEACTDIDQCLGIGRINRVKYLAILAKDWNIGIPLEVDLYEDISIKMLLSRTTRIVLEEVLVPSLSSSPFDNRRCLFSHYFKAARVTFSKSDVNRNRPKWGIRGGRTRCFYVPCWQGENLVPLQFAVRLYGTKYSDMKGMIVCTLHTPVRNSRSNDVSPSIIFIFVVKEMIFDAAKRVVKFINTECEHDWIRGVPYSSAYESEDVEGSDFKFSTSGGPLLSFLIVLLLPVIIPCEAIEFSICTYNNKRYGASVNLEVSRVYTESSHYAEEVFHQLKEDTLYTPVWYIPRFLSTMAEHNILEPSGVKCHFGKDFLNTY